MTDDGADKDAEIETLKREVLELQCRIKEESERYEVDIFEPSLTSQNSRASGKTQKRCTSGNFERCARQLKKHLLVEKEAKIL